MNWTHCFFSSCFGADHLLQRKITKMFLFDVLLCFDIETMIFGQKDEVSAALRESQEMCLPPARFIQLAGDVPAICRNERLLTSRKIEYALLETST